MNTLIGHQGLENKGNLQLRSSFYYSKSGGRKCPIMDFYALYKFKLSVNSILFSYLIKPNSVRVQKIIKLIAKRIIVIKKFLFFIPLNWPT